jgi:hypothetical protein
MNHADFPVSRERGLAVGAWTILVMAAILGLASNQTSQLLATHFQFGERAVTSAAIVVETAAEPMLSKHQTFPMILTVPFAFTRAQQMVARVKQRDEFAHRTNQVRSGFKGTPALLAGLALIGASSPNY